MNRDFDVLIVGSGPAGVSASFPLVEAGVKVLMVDGGLGPSVTPPVAPFLEARQNDVAQWRWMVGEHFHALKNADAVSPKLRVPTHDHVFRQFAESNKIESKGFISLGSLATGGLSNAWGCGVARLSGAELSSYPFPASEMDASYEAVTRRIGVSGAVADSMTEYFGLDAWAQPPIALDPLHAHLLARYERKAAKLQALGVRLGRSRVAVLSEDQQERRACNLSGNCMWGCARKSLYSAADELATLKGYPAFQHMPGFVIQCIQRTGDGWQLSGTRDGCHQNITAARVVLAAGTLATTRLVLDALDCTDAVPLRSCPTAAFLIWVPRLLGQPRTATFGLGQLSFAVQAGDVRAFGSTFSTTGIAMSEFLERLPLGRRQGVRVLRHLLSSCAVGNLFLPGTLTNASARLTADRSLVVDGGYDKSVGELMEKSRQSLSAAFRKIGGVMLPSSFTLGAPGADIHYACSLPMRENPQRGEVDAMGEVKGLPGIYVADGASLSALSEKSHTLTIMANADRIGRKLAARA